MKKGISPLISSVLILGFAIALFLLITNFIKSDVVDETLDKTTSKLEKQLDCSGIQVEIVNGCVDDLNSANKVGVNVDNFGDDVSKLVIRVLNDNGDLGVAEFSSDPVISPNRIISKSELLDLNLEVSVPSKIEVYVRSDDGKLCEGSVEVLDKIEKC